MADREKTTLENVETIAFGKEEIIELTEKVRREWENSRRIESPWHCHYLRMGGEEGPEGSTISELGEHEGHGKYRVGKKSQHCKVHVKGLRFSESC